MNVGKNIRGAASLLAVAALAATGLAFTSGAAYGAPGDGTLGSITVHKLEQPETGNIGANDGSQLTIPSEVTPIDDAGFTVCEVAGIDLTTSAGWEAAKGIVATSVGGTLTVTDGTNPLTCTTVGSEIMTGASGTPGEATFADLPSDKVYVVYESTLPEGALYDSAPAVVTLPYPGNGSGDVWNYHPHIYPKNTLVGGGTSKNGEVVGSDVTFTITVPLNPITGGDYAQLAIDDPLSGQLELVSATVTLTNSSSEEVSLTENTDFTLATSNNTVNLNFVSPAGITKINTNIGGTVTLTIKAKAIATGDTTNEATITINGTETKVNIPEEEIEKFFAGFQIRKLAQNVGASTTVPLAGAQFALYVAPSGGCPADAPGTSDPSYVDTGSVSLESANSTGLTPAIVLGEGTYCAYETVVPAGYNQAAVTTFTVSAAGQIQDIINDQIGSGGTDGLPALPVTGAAGQVLMALAGIALVSLAVGLYLVKRRRTRNNI